MMRGMSSLSPPSMVPIKRLGKSPNASAPSIRIRVPAPQCALHSGQGEGRRVLFAFYVDYKVAADNLYHFLMFFPPDRHLQWVSKKAIAYWAGFHLTRRIAGAGGDASGYAR